MYTFLNNRIVNRFVIKTSLLIDWFGLHGLARQPFQLVLSLFFFDSFVLLLCVLPQSEHMSTHIVVSCTLLMGDHSHTRKSGSTSKLQIRKNDMAQVMSKPWGKSSRSRVNSVWYRFFCTHTRSGQRHPRRWVQRVSAISTHTIAIVCRIPAPLSRPGYVELFRIVFWRANARKSTNHNLEWLLRTMLLLMFCLLRAQISVGTTNPLEE